MHYSLDILTVKEKDGDNDRGSKLNRPGIYRVNLGDRKLRTV